MELRQSPSVDTNGVSLNDNTVGFSYFPGYAVDVETGKRLNIFFGENSVYSGDNAQYLDDNNPIGGDMIFNPSPQIFGNNLANQDRALLLPEDIIIFMSPDSNMTVVQRSALS